MKISDGRIPTLDGWRSIAIVMVLVCHYLVLFYYRGYHDLVLFHYQGHYVNVELGQHGVQLFFVLSGFLITSILISRDQIDLKAFYIRRVFRILPVVISYVIVFAIILTILGFPVRGSGIAYVLLFIRNYSSSSFMHLSTTSSFTEQFWSLSVEEQFYILWPAILYYLGRRYASLLAGVIVVLVAGLRIVFWNYFRINYKHTEVRIDGLLIGCLLAIVLQHKNVREFITRYAYVIFIGSATCFLYDCVRLGTAIPTQDSISISLMIASTILRPKMIVGRILECRVLKLIGITSYSMYIWQTMFLRPEWGYLWPVLLVGSVVLSYIFIEAPMRRIGQTMASKCTKKGIKLLETAGPLPPVSVGSFQ